MERAPAGRPSPPACRCRAGRDSAGRERSCTSARAVKAKARLAAPEIGHAEKPLGHSDPISFECVQRGEVLHHHGAPRRNQRVAGVPVLCLAGDGHLRAKRERVERRRFDVGLAEGEGPERRDLVGRLGIRLDRAPRAESSRRSDRRKAAPSTSPRHFCRRHVTASPRSASVSSGARRMGRAAAARAPTATRIGSPTAKRSASTLPMSAISARSARTALSRGSRGFMPPPPGSRRQSPRPSRRSGPRGAPGTAHRRRCAERARCGGRPGPACGSPDPAGPSYRERA